MAITQTKSSLAFRQINEFPKSTPLAADANFTRQKAFSRLSLRVLSYFRAPSTTCVPAELRVNWVNVARVANPPRRRMGLRGVMRQNGVLGDTSVV